MNIGADWNIDQIAAAVPLRDDLVRVIAYHYRLRIATQFIIEHASAPLSLPVVARKVHMHPGAFSRYFAVKTGMTVCEFIRMIKITMAEQRLLNDDCAITAVSAELGFGSVSAFTRNFKIVKGYSPTLYRKRVLRTVKRAEKQLSLALDRHNVS